MHKAFRNTSDPYSYQVWCSFYLL